MGRPQATSHAAIEAAAFRLFASQGFDATTVDDIAAAVGVGRRTLFRYFPSKNDIPWGRFDESLSNLRDTLHAIPRTVPIIEAIQQAVIEFNRLDEEAVPQHRQRMRLILGTPVLQAHSALRYQQWRAVIAEYAALRLGVDADSLAPRTIGQVSLALALSAYEQWLEADDGRLECLIAEAMAVLRDYVGDAGRPRRMAAHHRRGSS